MNDTKSNKNYILQKIMIKIICKMNSTIIIITCVLNLESVPILFNISNIYTEMKPKYIRDVTLTICLPPQTTTESLLTKSAFIFMFVSCCKRTFIIYDP